MLCRRPRLCRWQNFMEDPFVDKTWSLHPNANQLLERFYEDGVQELKQPRDRLSAPFGQEGSPLGPIMHCQIKDHVNNSRKVVVPLPGNIRAEFELDFAPRKFNQFTAFLPHPSALFFLKFSF